MIWFWCYYLWHTGVIVWPNLSDLRLGSHALALLLRDVSPEISYQGRCGHSRLLLFKSRKNEGKLQGVSSCAWSLMSLALWDATCFSQSLDFYCGKMSEVIPSECWYVQVRIHTQCPCLSFMTAACWVTVRQQIKPCRVRVLAQPQMRTGWPSSTSNQQSGDVPGLFWGENGSCIHHVICLILRSTCALSALCSGWKYPHFLLAASHVCQLGIRSLAQAVLSQVVG